MICKKTALGLCILLWLVTGKSTLAQNQWTYDFNNGLNPIENGGIPLKILGQPGKYVKEKIPGTEDLFRTTYRFEKNSGLQFSNTEAKGFLNKSFTIELYFKMDTLGSWKRVLDFKNRKSDFGCYIYDGKLNFYDLAISEKAPIRRNQYLHFVYSRDAETKVIKMYINGLAKIEFKDPGTEGALDQDQVLNIFQDDLVANQESSPGSLALVRIYDRVMTPVFIRRSYQSIHKVKQPVEIAEEPQPAEEKPVTVSEPKVISNLVEVTGRVYDTRNLKPIQGASVSVRKLKSDAEVTRTETTEGFYKVSLAPYETYKITVDAIGFQPKSMSIKTGATNQEIKSLFNLTPESYEAPLVTVYFTQSLEEMTPAAKIQLDSMINYFNRRKDLKIFLKGHTDNIGDFNKNVALSRQRVETVKGYLVNMGIPADRIEGQGYGPARPSSLNQNEAQKQSNRRVEVWAEPIKR